MMKAGVKLVLIDVLMYVDIGSGHFLLVYVDIGSGHFLLVYVDIGSGHFLLVYVDIWSGHISYWCMLTLGVDTDLL